MKNINSSCSVLLVFQLALLWVAPATRAQETGDGTQPPSCTDLSGKIPLPCPGQKNTAPARHAKAPAPALAPGSDVQGVSVPAAPASQRDASTANGLHPVSTTTPPPVKVEPPHAETQPSATSSASAAVVLTQGCTDLSGRHAVPCPAKTDAVVAAGATRGPDAGPGAAPSGVTSSAGIEPEPVSRPVGPRIHSPERALLRNLFADQKAIWGSPLRIRLDNVQWLVPLLGGAAVMIASDTDIQNHIPTSTSFRKNSNSFSNYGVAAFAGVTGATWMLGLATHNDKMRETGVLSGEAALDSFALTYAIKSITQRDRPNQGNGRGSFWSNGDSFPSEHAAAAWSVATVFAHEYPGPLPKLLAYGGAAAISAARVTADKHFASDALVGSAIGYFIGRQVYRAHHDQGLGDAAYGTFERARGPEGPRDPANMGSTYVALDSWVYGAMDRLAALGYINSAFAGLRPWTRMECARLLQEAEGRLASDAGGRAASVEAARLDQALRSEFFVESRRLGGEQNLSAELESVYTRFTGISGKPLNDGYHFGQTIVNDYGRPYQQGFNMVSGLSARAEAGPFAFYVRGEYQHAPSAAGYPQTVQDAIQTADEKPLIPAAVSTPTFNRFRLLEAYVALNLKGGLQASFGKQSLWLGPTQDPFLSSNNAQPYYMFRLSQTSPRKLPSLFKFLGPFRTEFWIGRLAGQHFVNTQDGNIEVSLGRSLARQPFVDGVKINFKPTPNLEFGVGKTGLFGGPRFPVTLRAFLRSEYSRTNSSGVTDPGDRRSSFDFTYRLPGLRHWLILYNDSFVEDEISPIGYPRRAAQNQGLYMPQVPMIPKLDFRVEGGYTNLPDSIQPPGGGFFYWNVRYLDGYTNNGNIIGNGTVGRQGIAFRAASTYWFDADKTIQVGYRNTEADAMFLGGGNLRDVSLRSEWSFGKAVSMSSLLQYEWWNFPLLSAGTKQSNFTASVQITWRPHLRINHEK